MKKNRLGIMLENGVRVKDQKYKGIRNNIPKCKNQKPIPQNLLNAKNLYTIWRDTSGVCLIDFTTNEVKELVNLKYDATILSKSQIVVETKPSRLDFTAIERTGTVEVSKLV